eukprot:jgi/Mesvir1/10451/Mv12082-RA.1
MMADGAKWPTSTPLCCWWCCHPFDGVPFPLPTRMTRHDTAFCVTGCFCSPNCAKAYNLKEGGACRDLRNHYLFIMAQRLWRAESRPSSFPGVIAAPPRQCLKMFGGHMDVDEFRSSSARGEVHMLAEPPFAMEYATQVDCVTTISSKNAGARDGGKAAGEDLPVCLSRKRPPQAPKEEASGLAMKRARPAVNKACSLDKFVNVINNKKK